MRTFIAIDISEEIRKALERVEAHLKYSGADVKWVDPAIIHLTMKFLGEIRAEKAEEVIVALDRVAAATAPFDISIKEIGAFPRIEYPRVIWVGLDRGAQETTALAGSIESALSKVGFQKEERPFSPHLTIGRVRSPLNKAKLKEKMASAVSAIDLSATDAHTVSSVILFKSTLTPQGPVYTKLHEAAFRQ